MARKTFERILLEAVDDGLSALGDSARQSVYFHLESKFKIAKSAIPYRIEDFEGGLERIFGEGSRFLEILIMRKLYAKIDLPLEWNENQDLVFASYVAAAKQGFIRKER